MPTVTKKHPWFKFHTQDWRGDGSLRVVSLAARGLWIEMLALMHEAPVYGHLVGANGEPLEAHELALIVGAPVQSVEALLAELEGKVVFSRTKARVIYSRRLVRDHNRARISQENGKMGGNPSLGKQKASGGQDNPQDKPIEARSQKPEDSSDKAAAVILPPPPPQGWGLSENELAMVSAFDEALVQSFGETARRRGIAASDQETAKQLLTLGYTPDEFRAVCVGVMGKAAVGGRSAPGSLSYCLKAAIEARSGKPRAPGAVAASENIGARVGDDEVWRRRLDGFKKRKLWLSSWGPEPGHADCRAPKALIGQLVVAARSGKAG